MWFFDVSLLMVLQQVSLMYAYTWYHIDIDAFAVTKRVLVSVRDTSGFAVNFPRWHTAHADVFPDNDFIPDARPFDKFTTACKRSSFECHKFTSEIHESSMVAAFTRPSASLTWYKSPMRSATNAISPSSVLTIGSFFRNKTSRSLFRVILDTDMKLVMRS